MEMNRVANIIVMASPRKGAWPSSSSLGANDWMATEASPPRHDEEDCENHYTEEN